MLQVDFALIPLSAEDRRKVDEEVAAKISSGNIPPLDKSESGRLVVLNPDPVQTTHHSIFGIPAKAARLVGGAARIDRMD